MRKTIVLLATLLSAICFSSFAQEKQKPEYGYKVSDFMSTPKVGGYIIGGYKYSDLESAHGGPGFNCRLIRLYVDGSIFNDFKYRIQFQANGEKPHVKDFFVEWAKYKEFSVKLGQFKRAFTFENPMNPWDVGVGDFSFLVQKMAGMGDRLGEANMGGRDQGIQVQGDLFPIGGDQYRLVHYQLGLYNGQGINLADANKEKDIIGTIQLQPIKGLYIGAFAWKGDWVKPATDTDPAVTLKRERISAGLKYDVNNWSVRAEYATAVGGEKQQSGAADALYVTVGVPVADWLKVYAKWDEFRAQGNAESSHDMYSGCLNFRLHKNLNFQLEYRYHDDKFLGNRYNELWFMSYIRF
ncbi:MAG: porin [Bacteroidales bacterium]|nr:porin [Bacteroidales bacterium]